MKRPDPQRGGFHTATEWLRRHLAGLLAGTLVGAGTLLVIRGVTAPREADWGVTSLLVVVAVLVTGIAVASSRLSTAHQLAIVAALAAFATASRLLFAALPNFKPVTFIVLVAGVALGPAPGFMVGATTGLVSNLFFYQAKWEGDVEREIQVFTPRQMSEHSGDQLGTCSGIKNTLNGNLLSENKGGAEIHAQMRDTLAE